MAKLMFEALQRGLAGRNGWSVEGDGVGQLDHLCSELIS